MLRITLVAPVLIALTASPLPPTDARAAEQPLTVEGERDAIGGEMRELGEEIRHGGAGTADDDDPERGTDQGGGVNPFEFNRLKRDQALWTGVVFLVLLAVLWKFAWRPIVLGLDRREYGIADNIAQAEKANADARELFAQYERKLAEARDEVRGIIDEGRREAEKQAQQVIDRANADADARVQSAMREIDDAADGAMKELARNSSALAVELAGRIVASELRPADHDRLIEQAINEFAKQN